MVGERIKLAADVVVCVPDYKRLNIDGSLYENRMRRGGIRSHEPDGQTSRANPTMVHVPEMMWCHVILPLPVIGIMSAGGQPT
jgi:hypothetical protein